MFSHASSRRHLFSPSTRPSSSLPPSAANDYHILRTMSNEVGHLRPWAAQTADMAVQDTASPPAPIAGQKRPRESSSPPAGANGVANGGAGGSNGRPVKRGRTSFFAPIYDDTESESDSAAAPSQARPINRPVRARLSLTASARRSVCRLLPRLPPFWPLISA